MKRCHFCGDSSHTTVANLPTCTHCKRWLEDAIERARARRRGEEVILPPKRRVPVYAIRPPEDD